MCQDHRRFPYVVPTACSSRGGGMFLRAASVTALMLGLSLGASGPVMAQLLPPLPPLGTAPPPMRPLPPPAVDNDDDLPPYDPPPGYRRPAPGGAYGQPQRTYESEALPPPGVYAAPGREPAYQPPQGQYGPPPQGQYAPPQGQYAAPGREPAYQPPPQ